MNRRAALALFAVLVPCLSLVAEDKNPGIAVDKKAKTVTIDCLVAPRKLPKLDQIYPIEVVACFPAPKGQKAHETVVTFTAKPSDIHKALESLGLKAGVPARGKDMKPMGPEVTVSLELPGADGKKKLIPIEETMIDKKSGKPLEKLRWLFTGSVMTNPDPEKDDKVYGADLTGTLITLFPVTNETVLQSALNFDQEASLKVETNDKVLPKVGTAVKLVIQAK